MGRLAKIRTRHGRPRRKASTEGIWGVRQEPAAGDLLVGEIAINTADGLSFVKHTDNTVKILGRNYLAELLDVSNAAPVDGNSLKWNADEGEWEPGSVTVEGISNINIDELEVGQVLEWTGTEWQNAYADISNSKVKDLGNVTSQTRAMAPAWFTTLLRISMSTVHILKTLFPARETFLFSLEAILSD